LFGSPPRTRNIIDEITSNLEDIADHPLELNNWVDIIFLAFDGAWRAGYEPSTIIRGIKSKQAVIEGQLPYEAQPTQPTTHEDGVDERRLRCYIAGPISGVSDFRDRFNKAEQRLTGLGFEPINPCNISPATHEGECPPGYGPGEGGDHTSSACFMRTDLKALLECDVIYLLPGWQHSRGAKLEYSVAVACGIPVLAEKVQL